MLILALAGGSTGAVLGSNFGSFPIESGTIHSPSHQRLYDEYEASSKKSLFVYEVKRAELRKAAFESAVKSAKNYQTDGRLDELLLARALRDRLDPSSDKEPSLKMDAKAPGDLRAIEAKWLTQSRELEIAEAKSQRRMASQYGAALSSVVAALVKESKLEAAAALKAQCESLAGLEAAPVAPFDLGGSRKVDGHIHAIKGDDDWSLFVNGKKLQFDELKSEKLTLSLGDIVVAKVGTRGRKEILIAFVSTDGDWAIHLRYDQVKVLDDGDPAAVTPQMIAGSERHPRGGPMVGTLHNRWLGTGMARTRDGGSGWLKLERGGDYLVAFEVTRESIAPFPRK